MLVFVFDELINLMFNIDLYSFVCDRPMLPLPYSSMMGKPQRSCAELFGCLNQELVESIVTG